MNGIDWDGAKKRLRAGELALKQAFESDPEKLGHVLRARTLNLARGEQQKRQESTVLLKFRLSQQSYAIPLQDLAGVHKFQSFTPLPGAPPQLLGLVSHRGKILSLLSLKRLLLENDASPENPDCALILRELKVACCVDALEDIVEFDKNEIGTHEGDAVPRLAVGPGGLLILTGSRLAEHSYFKTREVGL